MSLTTKQLAEIDQGLATYVDLTTISMKRLYDGLINAGFQEKQALHIIAKSTSDLMLNFFFPKKES